MAVYIKEEAQQAKIPITAGDRHLPHGNTNPDSELNPAAKRLLVVESASLPRNFYRGPRPGRRLVSLDGNEIGARRLAEVGALG